MSSGSEHAFETTPLQLPSTSRLGDRRLARRRAWVSGVVLLTVMIVGVAVGGGANDPDFMRVGMPPHWPHLFGTDWMGRDILIRTSAGLSTSIVIGILAASASAVIAVMVGASAAAGPKWLDDAVTWLIDLLLGIPHLLLIILISIALGRGFWGVAIGVALTHWPALARVVRAEVLQVKQSIFVAQARALGQTRRQIALRHYLPALMPQVMVGAVLQFPHAIMHEAAVTFLGFGLPVDSAAVGVVLSEASGYLTVGMWWAALFPGLALLGVVLMFNVFVRAFRALMWGRR